MLIVDLSEFETTKLLNQQFARPPFVLLTGILCELIEHDKVSTAAVTMDGQMFGKNEHTEGSVILTEEDILLASLREL